jgi:hypothetical protein
MTPASLPGLRSARTNREVHPLLECCCKFTHTTATQAECLKQISRQQCCDPSCSQPYCRAPHGLEPLHLHASAASANTSVYTTQVYMPSAAAAACDKLRSESAC